jgi:hypothetical protein
MDTKTKVNNSEEVWAFFKRFSLNTTAVIARQTFSGTREGIRVSYSAGAIRLQGIDETARIRVFDTKGKLVSDATGVQPRIALKDKTSGVYVILVNGREGSIPLKMAIPDRYK